MQALEWSRHEFATLDLGDKRRVDRVCSIVSDYTQIPESTPHAHGSPSALLATYRCVNSASITPEAIMESHREATLERMRDCQTVLLIQDTTVVDLTKPKQQVRGAGALESNNKFGYFWHPLYAVCERGIPLGIAHSIQWTREPIREDLTRAKRKQEKRNAEIVEKESSRWLETFQASEQLARATPSTQFIHVADSESDIHELLLEREDQAHNHNFILRSGQDRSIVCSDASGPKTIDEALALAPVVNQYEVEVSPRVAMISNETRDRKASRDARQATISLRVVKVRIKGPSRPGGRLANIDINIVQAVELAPPPGETPISWILFTSLAVDTPELVQRVVQYYAMRWQIELLFKTLKSGLGIEKLKYETLEAYQTMAAMLYVVAFRVEQLKAAARVEPEAPCTKYFEDSEWKPLVMVVKKGRKLPTEPPTIQEIIQLVARAGGYIAGKHRPPPGSQVVWRGLQKVQAYREAYLEFIQTKM